MTATINASTSSGVVITPDNSGNILLQYNGVAAPAFSAYPSAIQSLSSGVATKLQYNTEEFDTANCYNTSNYRFTPTVAGYYQVNGMVGVASTSTPAIVILYKNGSAFKLGTVSLGSATSYPYSGVSALVYMNGTTDYLELYGLSPGGTYNTWSGSSENNYFQACLLRGA